QLVDQASLQILLNGRDSAAYAHVATARRGLCLLKCRVNAVGDEPELGPTCHRHRRPRMMREHKHRSVVGGLVAPPSLPALIRPGAADGTKHVATEDPSTDAGKAELRHVVVDAGLAVAVAIHPLEHARGMKPAHDVRSADPERMFDTLIRPRAVPVHGNPETQHTNLRHDNTSMYGVPRTTCCKLLEMIYIISTRDARAGGSGN